MRLCIECSKSRNCYLKVEKMSKNNWFLNVASKCHLLRGFFYYTAWNLETIQSEEEGKNNEK